MLITAIMLGGLTIDAKIKYGFVNANGEEVIPCIYDDAHPFVDGLAKVGIDE